jgi:hypothetical protein
MNDWLDRRAPIDWMNRRSTWQFFFVYFICTSTAGLLGEGVIDWIATGHANVRLLIIFGVAFLLITAIPFTLTNLVSKVIGLPGALPSHGRAPERINRPARGRRAVARDGTPWRLAFSCALERWKPRAAWG